MNNLIWLLPIALVVFLWWRAQGASMASLQALVARGAQRVDVRNPGEFAAGHAPGTVNIPLGELEGRLGELDAQRPVILCCASGSRSAMAASMLKAKGFEAVNAGPWARLQGLS